MYVVRIFTVITVFTAVLYAGPNDLYDAIYEGAGGNENAVARILRTSEGKQLVNNKIHGYSLLHHAVEKGNSHIVVLLLETGAKLEARNVSGETPLHVVAVYGHCDIAEILLRWRASLDVRDAEQNTPLKIAAKMGNERLVNLFVLYGADKSELPELATHMKAVKTYTFTRRLSQGFESVNDLRDITHRKRRSLLYKKMAQKACCCCCIQ